MTELEAFLQKGGRIEIGRPPNRRKSIWRKAWLCKNKCNAGIKIMEKKKQKNMRRHLELSSEDFNAELLRIQETFEGAKNGA